MRIPFGVGPPQPGDETTSPPSSHSGKPPSPAREPVLDGPRARRGPGRPPPAPPRRRRPSSREQAQVVGRRARDRPAAGGTGSTRSSAKTPCSRSDARLAAACARAQSRTNVDLGVRADDAGQLLVDRLDELLERRPHEARAERRGCTAASGAPRRRARPPSTATQNALLGVAVGVSTSVPAMPRIRLLRASSASSSGPAAVEERGRRRRAAAPRRHSSSSTRTAPPATRSPSATWTAWHDARVGRDERRLHLHRLEHDERLARRDAVARPRRAHGARCRASAR